MSKMRKLWGFSGAFALKVFIALISLSFFMGIGYAKTNLGQRMKICLNGEWDFHAGNEDKVPDSGWIKIRVPGVSWYRNAGWYRLNFKVPSSWDDGRVIKILFYGVDYYAKVFVNRNFMGEHYGLLTQFSFDITDVAKFGKTNELLVFVDTGIDSIKKRGFSEASTQSFRCAVHFSGINRDVYLISHPKIYVKDTFVITSFRKKEITVKTWIRNESNKPEKVTIVQQIEKDSRIVLPIGSKEIILKPGETKMIEITKSWKNPELWGFGKWGKPVLYFLHTSLREKHRIVDTYFTRFGFREFWRENGQFYLNGKKIYILGQSSPLYGGPFSRGRLNRQFLSILLRAHREANISLIRSHTFVESPNAYDVYDELGMLAEPEFGTYTRGLGPKGKWRTIDSKNFVDYEKGVIKSCVIANRNHPSIVMWSDDNESCSRGITPKQVLIHKAFYDEIKRYDPTTLIDSNGNAWLFRAKERFNIDFKPDIFNIHPYGVPIYPEVQRQMIARGWDGKAPVYMGELTCHLGFRAIDKKKQLKYKSVAFRLWRAKARFWHDAIITFYKKGLAGCAPHTLYYYGYWGPIDENTFVTGPWGEIPDARKRIVPWPSLSGQDAKIEHGYYGGIINFFDPEKPFYTPNIVHKAIGEAYREATGSDVGKLNPRRAPEVIVKVTMNKKPVVGEYVYLIPLDNQSCNPQGVMTDKNGTAWFILKEPGKYKAVCEIGDRVASTELRAKYGKTYAKKPGFQIVYASIEVGKTDVPNKANTSSVNSFKFSGPFNVDNKGFIRNWLIIGPFPNPGNREIGCSGWRTDFLAKYGGEEKYIACKGMVVKTKFGKSDYWKSGKATLKWFIHTSKKHSVDLGKFITYEPLDIVITPANYVTAYGFCYVQSPIKRKVTIAIGADDDYKVWLNNKYVGGKATFGGCVIDKYTHKTTLKKGMNPLLIKVGTDIGGWKYCVRFLDENKKPVKDIKILLPESKK